MIDFYQIPIKQIKEIKAGADFVTADGRVIPNEKLTSPPDPPRRYAYCSDTAYCPEIIPYIEGVNVLYHEATFAESEAVRAQETFHSTARQAAQIAKDAGVKNLFWVISRRGIPNWMPFYAKHKPFFPTLAWRMREWILFCNITVECLFFVSSLCEFLKTG